MVELEFIRDATKETITCPFCGNNENKYRSLMAIKMAILIYYIKCEGCAACGPLGSEYPDPESAIAGWNKRVRLPITRTIPGRQGIGAEIADLYPTFTPRQLAEKFNVSTSMVYYHLNKKYGNLSEYRKRLNPETHRPWRVKMKRRNKSKQGEIERIRQLRSEGKTWKEVSRIMGKSVSYCQAWASRPIPDTEGKG